MMNLYDNDFISVKSKKQASAHIIQRYGDFGWELIENKDDKFYGDVTYLTFTRPHVLQNKDELQLLQVRLEIAYNNTGKLARKSKGWAVLFSHLCALFASAFAVGGVALMLFLNGAIYFALGWLLCVLGVATCIFGGIAVHRNYLKDKKKNAILMEKEVQKIDELCARAKKLRGKNEQEV